MTTDKDPLDLMTPEQREWFNKNVFIRPPEQQAQPVVFAKVQEEDTAADELACAWADYRKHYGVSADDIAAAHKAFKAGWKAAREGDQSGVLR